MPLTTKKKVATGDSLVVGGGLEVVAEVSDTGKETNEQLLEVLDSQRRDCRRESRDSTPNIGDQWVTANRGRGRLGEAIEPV